jgi:hypothetical protein
MEERPTPNEGEGVEDICLRERLRLAQELVARHVAPGAMLSEELMAERRASAAGE